MLALLFDTNYRSRSLFGDCLDSSRERTHPTKTNMANNDTFLAAMSLYSDDVIE